MSISLLIESEEWAETIIFSYPEEVGNICFSIVPPSQPDAQLGVRERREGETDGPEIVVIGCMLWMAAATTPNIPSPPLVWLEHG